MATFFKETSPEARGIKAKINYWDYVKLKKKNFHKVKNTINKTKRQTIEWENIFANGTADEGLVSKIYIKKTYKTQHPKNK